MLEILKISEPRNVILEGEEGLGMEADALSLAAAWLQVEEESLESHPNFLRILPENGTIRAEVSEQIRNRAAYLNTQKAVCIVERAELMTPEMQNKLLKCLEDGSDSIAVIFVAYGPLLDTVVSRSITIPYRAYEAEELYQMIQRPSIPVLLASGGSPGVYQKILSDAPFTTYLEGFASEFLSFKTAEQTRNILRMTHAMREKDKEYLPGCLEDWQMRAFLVYLKEIFYFLLLKQEGLEIPSFIHLGFLPKLYSGEDAISLYRSLCEMLRKRKGMFTKHDFFYILMQMITEEEPDEKL